jgi:DNA repair exonuclease SbcCD nuclease subunit
MKFILYSDVHAHNFKTHSRVDHSRLDYCIDAIKAVYQKANDEGINVVVFGGDLFDNQRLLPTEVVNRLVDLFINLSEDFPEIVCYAISGNHDYATKNLLHSPAITALTHIERIIPDNFVIIDNQVRILENEKVVLVGIPYYELPEHYNTVLSEISNKVDTLENKNVPKILIIHQTPTGLANPNIPTDTDVNDELYDSFDMVFCGHIHQKQDITPKFSLIGSPLHRDLGDEGDEKGFWIVDTETMTKKFVSTKGNFPEFIRVELSLGQGVPKDDFNYIVPIWKHAVDGTVESVNTENFSSALSPTKLLENYWNEVDGVNKGLLEAGLQCINITIKDNE